MSTQPMTSMDAVDAVAVGEEPQRLETPCASSESVEPKHGWYLICKPLVGFVTALMLSAIAAPLVLLGAILVKLTSRGPAFYWQTRVGKDGRTFKIYKLRTMVVDAEMHTGPVWAGRDDPRITPLGRILRITHIDELPQLLNVLMGQMGLVGPRPERPELVPQLQSKLPRYAERLKLRPGMTGMAQLRLPPDSDLESVRRKLAYDLYYIQHANPWLDARILFLTFLLVIADALKLVWKLIALPPWETIERQVSPIIRVDAAHGGGVGDGREGDGDPVAMEHAMEDAMADAPHAGNGRKPACSARHERVAPNKPR